MTRMTRPSFGRSMSVMWIYTLARFGLFGVLYGILWLVGVGGFLGAIIALALSVPLSWVLLARPRQAFAANIEQRVNARVAKKAAFDAELDGTELDSTEFDSTEFDSTEFDGAGVEGSEGEDGTRPLDH
jgi:Protein of unknown function (DUF4229)